MRNPNTICDNNCGTSFYKRPSQKKISKHHYCSNECCKEDVKRRRRADWAAQKSKTCTVCEEEKDIEEFHYRNKETGQRQSYCAKCGKGQHRKHYVRHKKRYVKQARKNTDSYRKRNLAFTFSYLRAHPCVHCGCDDITILQFHHVDGKEAEVSVLVHSGYTLERVKKEISKCVILCPNCHRKETLKAFGGHPFERYGWV